MMKYLTVKNDQDTEDQVARWHRDYKVETALPVERPLIYEDDGDIIFAPETDGPLKNIRGILINPADQTVTEVILNQNDYLQGINENLDCQLVDRIVLDDQNDLWVDDEGFMVRGNPLSTLQREWFAGRGLILGYDDEGNSVNTTKTIVDVISELTFTDMTSDDIPF